MFCDQTDCGSLFHSVGEAIAKLHLPLAFLGRTEERESRFPQVRLLVLIKVDNRVGWEKFIALNVIRLYLNKIRYEMRSQCSFCREEEVTWLVLSSLKTIIQRAF